MWIREFTGTRSRGQREKIRKDETLIGMHVETMLSWFWDY